MRGWQWGGRECTSGSGSIPSVAPGEIWLLYRWIYLFNSKEHKCKSATKPGEVLAVQGLCVCVSSDRCCSVLYSSPAPSLPSWWTEAAWAHLTPALRRSPATRRSSHSWCSQLEAEKSRWKFRCTVDTRFENVRRQNRDQVDAYSFPAASCKFGRPSESSSDPSGRTEWESAYDARQSQRITPMNMCYLTLKEMYLLNPELVGGRMNWK